MSQITEIEALAAIDNTLSKLEDPAARDRVLIWAWGKFSSKPLPLTTKPVDSPKRGKKSKKQAGSHQLKSKPKASIVRDINLRPDGKNSFKEFAEEKGPKTNQEKCTLSVYYLSRVLEISEISINHIYTCYKEMKWRVAGLYNVLVLTSHRKGWVDTSNMNAISLTTHGENLVEQDLPRKPKK